LIADASDPNSATTISNYFNNIIHDYNGLKISKSPPPMQILAETKMLYNPELKGAPNFVPGVIALVLMLLCTMMSSVSIVKEKELGTMEILLVSPFKPIFIIVSKLMPYMIISIFNLIIILVMSVTLLDLEIKGSIMLLIFASTLFILTSLAIGLLISTTAKTQQSAMMISLTGMLLPTLLLTGFMFPIENMPLPLKLLSNIVPSRWFFIIIKNVMLKGLGIGSIWKQLLILSGMCAFLLRVSIKKFKIRLQ
jgi:ABC-2 type transport system permease protein